MVEPIPDAESIDLSTTILLTLFLIFSFALGFCFFNVVIRVASSTPSLKPSICSLVEPVVILTLSSVKSSVVPSLFIKVYLSGLNGKNVSFVPAETCSESWPALIRTLWVFLILIVPSVKLTLEILEFGNIV